MELVNSIENLSNIFPAKKRQPKKHIIKYLHVVDDDGNIERVFYSVRSAARFIAAEKSNSAFVMITRVCHGEDGHKTACGKKWKYIDDDTFITYINLHPEWISDIDEKSFKKARTKLIIKEEVEATVMRYNPKTGEFSKGVEFGESVQLF